MNLLVDLPIAIVQFAVIMKFNLKLWIVGNCSASIFVHFRRTCRGASKSCLQLFLSCPFWGPCAVFCLLSASSILHQSLDVIYKSFSGQLVVPQRRRPSEWSAAGVDFIRSFIDNECTGRFPSRRRAATIGCSQTDPKYE